MVNTAYKILTVGGAAERLYSKEPAVDWIHVMSGNTNNPRGIKGDRLQGDTAVMTRPTGPYASSTLPRRVVKDGLLRPRRDHIHIICIPAPVPLPDLILCVAL